MTFSTEEVIDKVGGFGWYQTKLLIIACYAFLFLASATLVMTFSTAEPPWRCTTNSTSCALNGTFKAGDKDYEHRCSIPRRDWEFAVEGRFDSIVTEWDLVCDKSYYGSLTNSLMFIFWIFGNVLSSIVSDKFGRKRVAFLLLTFAGVCGILSAFAQTYWVFALFRALLGIGLAGTNPLYVLLMEFVGVRYRGAAGNGVIGGFILGLFWLSLMGYLIPSWRILTIVLSAPGIPFFAFWWFVPESLRWLMMKGKIHEAKKIIQTAARTNKKCISDEYITFVENKVEENKERPGSIKGLFSSRTITLRTLNCLYLGFVIGLVYYSIIMSSPMIGGNMYLNFFISALFEMIGTLTTIPLLNNPGRKITLALSLWFSGIVMVATALLTYFDDKGQGFYVGKILTALVLGRFFITVAFNTIYIYVLELFPTVVRNTAEGFVSGAVHFGSTFAPYIVYSERVHPLMPYGIMAANALISGILGMMLPETRKKAMFDTVKQFHIRQDISVKEEEIATCQEVEETRL